MNKVLIFQSFLKKMFQSIETIARLIFLSKFKVRIPKSSGNKGVIILGNGPSLKKDLEKYPGFLKGKDLICVNYFPTTELYEQLKPSYYITTAPEFWLEDVDQKYKNASKKIFESLASKTDWPIQLYIPFEAKKYGTWKEHLTKNTNIKIVYFNNTPVEGWNWFKNFLFSNKLGMPRPHNVMIPSLMVSIWLGYNEIYLLGADHSWLAEISVNDQNEVLINQKHFYDENDSKHRPMHKKGKGQRNLAEVLHKFMSAFFSYYEIRDYADKRSVQILNATKNSFIDAFQRIQLKED